MNCKYTNKIYTNNHFGVFLNQLSQIVKNLYTRCKESLRLCLCFKIHVID